MIKPFLFILVIIASWFNNFLIPLIIYAKEFSLFKKREKDFVGICTSGLIMDGFLAMLINIVILNFLLETGSVVNLANVEIATIAGFISMICAHLFMALRKWRVWIMPQPWRWNAGGYWHMFSMTIQMAFCFYPFILLIESPQLLNERITQASIILEIIFVSLFLFVFWLGGKGQPNKKLSFLSNPW